MKGALAILVLVGFCWIGWWVSLPFAEASELREAEILGVAAEGPSKQPYLLLREKGGKGILEIFIGPAEAQAIAIALNQQPPPRPLSYDLMVSVLDALKVRVKGVFITDLRDNIYYALLSLQAPAQELSFDSRPSDAIAVALRAGAPIWVATRLLKQPVPQANPTAQ